mmetsp:Transcript_57414/g.134416  ORF Transcript_57414/g.134416 Transcript_57414/m.134416 type:complete len:290 (+) Transcript_57414:26-895(+)
MPKRSNTLQATSFVAPKDGTKHLFVRVGNDAYESLSDPECFDDVDEGNIENWTATLIAPLAKCWSREDARRVWPKVEDAEYLKGEVSLGEMKVCLIRGETFHEGLATGDFESAFWEIDGDSQELYDMMNACTTLEERMATNPKKKRKRGVPAIFKSFTIPPDATSIPGVMFIKRLELEPRFCGKGLGAFLLEQGIAQLREEMFPFDHGPVYVKPFPLQWEHAELTAAQEGEMHADTVRLIEKFWKKVGFDEVDRSRGGGFDRYEYGYLVKPMDLFLKVKHLLMHANDGS